MSTSGSAVALATVEQRRLSKQLVNTTSKTSDTLSMILSPDELFSDIEFGLVIDCVPSFDNALITPVSVSSTSATLVAAPMTLTTYIDDTVATSNNSLSAMNDIVCAVNSVLATLPSPGSVVRKRSLFWVVVQIQIRCLWALADTGSCRNLMTESLFNSLQVQPHFLTRTSLNVIVGNGATLEVLGWCILRFAIIDRIVFHQVGIVRGLPVDFIVGGEIMKPHGSLLAYTPSGRNEFDLGQASCEICVDNKKILQDEHSSQLSTKYKRARVGPS